MNDICERLRSAVQLRRAARDAIDPAIGLPHTDLMLQAANEIARLRLTDAEREAVARAVHALNGVEDWSPDVIAKDKQAAETIAAMLARLA